MRDTEQIGQDTSDVVDTLDSRRRREVRYVVVDVAEEPRSVRDVLKQVVERGFGDGDRSLHGDSLNQMHAGFNTPGIRLRIGSGLMRTPCLDETSTVVTKHSDPRDHRMMIRIPTKLWEALKRVAAEDERSISDWIVTTLSEAIAKRDRRR